MKNRKMFFRSELNTHDSDEKIISGYFAVFDQETHIYDNMYEEIAPGAFQESLRNDIKCLFNHNDSIILGRTGNRTLELEEDSTGLRGVVKINEEDKEAMDIYARIKRGDINACSFSFYPVKETIEERGDGTVKFRVEKLDLLEVSPVTFPAYPQTSISARKDDLENNRNEILRRKKASLKERLANVKTNNA